MTRILSELLGAKLPAFQQGIQQLEQAGGRPAEDIRLTSDILHGMQDRVKQLGLDPRDTTGRELYHALMQRAKEDAGIFASLLGSGDGGQLTDAVARCIQSLGLPNEIFAVRAVAAKRLLRRLPPKRAMKNLGYRSLESMLKHEPCPLIFAAAHLCETATWHKSMLAAYRKLATGDFECRQLQVLAPQGGRWEKLAGPYVLQARQNIIGLREFGSVLLLPMPASAAPSGAALAMALLALQAANDITSASTYLKLCQVRPDFGALAARISRCEPLTKAEIGGAPLPWKTVHRYFARHAGAYNPALFEPHVQPADLCWRPAEDLLAGLHPRFGFWQGSSHLAAATKHGTVSLNMADALLNFCNAVPYEQRFVRYVREHIWHELLLRYMRQGNIEQAVHEQLGNELIEQTGVL